MNSLIQIITNNNVDGEVKKQVLFLIANLSVNQTVAVKMILSESSLLQILIDYYSSLNNNDNMETKEILIEILRNNGFKGKVD